ncbi:EAL domain/GGDEF domain protein [Cellvibrio japonicus Ueda107]|uniref:EAL domain/GGDEF domain protein n=2 Tax=Cellvibrio japonicus TaxID=155077 RepID=B3PFU3_CELJU|nr:EAL domain/GGDEF domain protein [Cellvibrio japonicus Ueda107]
MQASMSTDYPLPTPMDLHKELRRIIDAKLLNPVFQPIVALANPRILGYEALIRGPENSPLHYPDALFATARQSRLSAVLEFACREVSCVRFAELCLPGKLFLNMSPISFTDSQYRDGVTREILQRVGLSAERIVFELTESQPLDETELLRAASIHFQRQGFAIALDDLGAGYSGLRVWSELGPDYVKIDRHFIAGIDRDPVKREFVRAMLDIAHRMGNKAIAEGIETAEELSTLIAMGVEYAQGYFIARPQLQPPAELPAHVLPLCRTRPSLHQDSFVRKVGEILVDAQTVAPRVPAAEVVKLFRSDVRLACVPIVDGDRPLGMVSRAELLNVFAHRFAHELYAAKPIRDFISPLSVIVEIDTELKALGQIMTEDPQQNLSVDFIVCEQGRYRGVGKVRNLLRCITEEKLRVARHSNPLTQLPGNVPLYEWIDHLLIEQQPFVAAYCDINHFKPFNDYFGYSLGDEVILAMSRLLVSAIDQRQDFIGHVGGDDFVVVFRSSDWLMRCEQLMAAFTQVYCQLVPADQQVYWSQDRQGRRQIYGPLTLAIGCVVPEVGSCKTHHQIAQLLAEAKHAAKRQEVSQVFVSRRRRPLILPG